MVVVGGGGGGLVDKIAGSQRYPGKSDFEHDVA